ncbi:MAG: hypothetical protein M3548_12890 [Actinomycetota bacterium]|nr:hypothetical protein [Actinomycetota bacterium]
MVDQKLPGEGPTTAVSVSIHTGTVGAVSSRVGQRGAEPPVRRQIERDNLDELIAAAEAEHGALTALEIESKRKPLAVARVRP